MKQLVNVLISVLLAVALSGSSILTAEEAGPVAGNSISEFSMANEKQGDQEGTAESSETEPRYSSKQIVTHFTSLYSTPPEEGTIAQETEAKTEMGNVPNDNANTVDKQGGDPEKTGQDGAEASTGTTPGNEVTADESDKVGEVSQSVHQGVSEGSAEDFTVPETSAPSLEQAEIEQKYVTKLKWVISDYERESMNICDSAGHDLSLTSLGVESGAEKYRSAAQALEANCDGYYYLALANFRRELQSGGYPDDVARSMQERYESTKQQYAARLDEVIGK